MVLLNVPRAAAVDHDDLLDLVHRVVDTSKSAAPIARQLLDILSGHFDPEAETAGPLLAVLGNPIERPTPNGAATTRYLLDISGTRTQSSSTTIARSPCSQASSATPPPARWKASTRLA